MNIISQPAVEGRKSVGHLALAAGAVLVMLAGLALLSAKLSEGAAHRDFISYWSAAKLLAAHHNPYDSTAILKLENDAGASFINPLIMRNPPWSLFLVAPLGWWKAPIAVLLWTMSLIVIALVSIRLLWTERSKPVPLTAFLFAPVLACEMAGQISMFLLLGAALFFRLERKRPFAAGLALTLLLLKPHLFLPFWPVLLLEVCRRRQFRMLAGIAAGLAPAIGFAMHADPQIWSHYLTAARGENIATQYFPNLSCALRALVPGKPLWLQLLPALLCVGWACWFWMRHRRHWDWSQHGSLLIAASVLTAPYSWVVDQALFLPAVLTGFALASKQKAWILSAVNLVAAVVVFREASMSSPASLWMAPTWMIWCLWARAEDNPVTSTEQAIQPA